MSESEKDRQPTEDLIDVAGAFNPGAPTDVDPTRWSAPEPEALDALFPDYKIQQLLGRGGMGAVYKAVEKTLDREVAIKLLPAEMAAADPSFGERFLREARAMAQLNHPNIVHVYAFGQTDEGHSWFAMEFVDGMEFHQLLHSGQLDHGGALNAVSQICDALEYAHEEGYVHRDIKPANIFINQKGVLKVGDFGLAKIAGSPKTAVAQPESALTMAGTIMGTPDYSAPEQLDGREVDHRADIYSLGVMFYEMLTGQIPRGAFDPPSKKGGADERLDHVVLKAMQSEPEQRYPSASEMRTEVDAVRTGDVADFARNSKADGSAAASADDESLATSATKTNRLRLQQGLIFFAVLLICAAAGFFWYASHQRMKAAELQHGPTISSDESEKVDPPVTPEIPAASNGHPGRITIIPLGDGSDEIALPTIPKSFDDVIQVSPVVHEGELILFLVRADGSAWRFFPGKQPELKGKGVRQYRQGNSISFMVLENGEVEIRGTPDLSPFREDLDQVIARGIQEVFVTHQKFVARDRAGCIHWLSDPEGLEVRSIRELPSGTGFKAFALGFDHGIAIDASDAVVGWGKWEIPDSVAEQKIKSIGAVGSTSWAIDNYGRIIAWGGGLSHNQSGDAKEAIRAVHDAEEIYTYATGAYVAIRRNGRRWSVFNRPSKSGEWISLPEVASTLEGCHFVAFTDGVASTNGFAVGIRPKNSFVEDEVEARQQLLGEKTDPKPQTQTPKLEDSPFPLPFPEFPPKRPEGAGRIVFVKLSEDAEPLPEWIRQVEERDLDDVVRVSKWHDPTYAEGQHLIALHSNGALQPFGRVEDSGDYQLRHLNQLAAHFDRDAVQVASEGTSALVLDGSGKIHPFPQNTELGFDTAATLSIGNPSCAISVGPKGDCHFVRTPNEDYKSISRREVIAHGPFVQVLSTNTRGNRWGLRADGSLRGYSIFDNRQITLPSGSAASLSESNPAVLTAEGKILVYYGQRQQWHAISGLPPVDPKGSRLITDTHRAAILQPDGSVIICGDTSLGGSRMREAEEALSRAHDLKFWGNDYLIAVLPAETVSRSGFWEVDALIADRQQLLENR